MMQSNSLVVPETSASQWRNGWLGRARQLPSPNFGSRPDSTTVDLIVVHSISLPPARYGGQFVQQFFTNCLDLTAHDYFENLKEVCVSAHFYIQRCGQLWQFVSVHDRAWHAGVSSFQGREQCNDFSVGIELEGLEGSKFEAAQYACLSKLCIEVRQVCPEIKSVVGHEHIAPGRKFDPGASFEWTYLQQATAWELQCFPALQLPIKP